MQGRVQGVLVCVDARNPAAYGQRELSKGELLASQVAVALDNAYQHALQRRRLEELTALYQGAGITPEKEVIAYCRIGERSSHTWFALTELLGYPKVKNYDGSWTEYGSLVGAPVEK